METLYNIFITNESQKVLESEVENLSISLDSIIMDYYKQGIIYFQETLKNYEKVNEGVARYQAHKYLNSYLYTYLKRVISDNELQFLLNNRVDTVLQFHHQLIKADLDGKISKIWVSKLYSNLKDLIKKQFSQLDHGHLISSLINCSTFRKYLYQMETDPTHTAKSLEQDSLIGLLMNYIDHEDKTSIIEKILYRLIYYCNEYEESVFSQWLCLLQRKNKRRAYVQQVASQLSSDHFMLNTLRFVSHIWHENYRNQITISEIEKGECEKAIIIKCVFRQIELTILPILTKYHYYINRRDEFNDINSNLPFYEYLTRYRDIIQQKISHYELLIRNNINLTYHSTISFYTWIISYLLNDDDMNEMSDTIVTLMEDIFDFVILSHPINTSLLKADETLTNPIFKTAMYIFTGKFQTTNPHLKILAFRCFYQLEKYKKEYQISDPKTFLDSLAILYIESNRLHLEDYGYNPKNILLAYLSDHLVELINVKEEIQVETLEKFINIIISDVNENLETYYRKIKFINSNLTSQIPSIFYDTINDLYLKIIENFRLVRNLTTSLSFPNIFRSLVGSLIFNTSYLVTLSKYDNLDNMIHLKLKRLCREIGKIYLNFISDKLFLEEIFGVTQNFNLSETREIFKMASIDNLSCLKDFLEKAERQNGQADKLDYPEEFLDPLLFSLIRDPVMLPSTETIMERSVIERQLLERPENPFDRSSLTLENLNSHNQREEVMMALEDHRAKLSRWISLAREKQNTKT